MVAAIKRGREVQLADKPGTLAGTLLARPLSGRPLVIPPKLNIFRNVWLRCASYTTCKGWLKALCKGSQSQLLHIRFSLFHFPGRRFSFSGTSATARKDEISMATFASAAATSAYNPSGRRRYGNQRTLAQLLPA
jgi:hypothetical protein